ncbi:hypothetical protein D6D01_01961 [Aureobasidium pullulans]|uniref:Prion-inhibition and propagation HeLo domain-containing protein n=1 Tax=Aureobasidium pullulans TaxID=5580 RepID=A0A4S9LWQ1_AURPU|nr:hypothetical protein D6D01_01961 [Aureobasidium pullulans]
MDHHESGKSLTDAYSLADLFADCVESINLIHGTHEESHSEEILTSQLGIEQARLLIWGDAVGICSPPNSTGITSAIPKHPGALNPEPERPLYFGTRDARLDDPRFRQRVEDSLHAIASPMTHLTKAKMLQTYGLDLFKGSPKVRENHMLAPNPFRLQAFREKLELLQEVVVAYPHAKIHKHLGVNKKSAWQIMDVAKATGLCALIREKVDYLVQLMDTQTRVDKAMRYDVRAMGWHPSEDMNATIRDTLKLSLLVEASETLYPEYSTAAQEAMDNVTDQWKGSHGYDAMMSDHHNPIIHKTASHTMLAQPLPRAQGSIKPTISPPKTPKKGKLLGALRPKLTRLFSGKSMDRLSPAAADPSRSRSESGPSGGMDGEALEPMRSKSLANDDLTHVLTHTATLESMISRHDQYPGR